MSQMTDYWFSWRNMFGGDPRQFGPFNTELERDAAASQLLAQCKGWVIRKWTTDKA